MNASIHASELEARAKNIRAVVLDVDGVLTDGRVTYISGGGELKNFHVRDGLGIQLLNLSRIRVAILSGRESEPVERRARELGISPVFQGIEDKISAFDQLVKELDVPKSEICYIGDDLPDLPIVEQVGLGMAVADAAFELRKAAHHVLRAGGGQGAVREAAELILKARGAWRV